jgi:hypothetical protein
MKKALAQKCLTGLHFGRKLKSQGNPKKRNAPLLLIPWLIYKRRLLFDLQITQKLSQTKRKFKC